MRNAFIGLTLTLLLAACAPGVGPNPPQWNDDGTPIEYPLEGAWEGCVYTPAVADVECGYESPERGPYPGGAPPSTVPPTPGPDPEPEPPEPEPEPDPPEEDPDDGPNETPEDEGTGDDPPEDGEGGEGPGEDDEGPGEDDETPGEDDGALPETPGPPVGDCKPGWGHGDKNHCHDGPPGHDRDHPVF